jgi:hypothetical protein
VAISRDDPVIAVVLLTQIVLRRYLEEAVAPVADAVRDATNETLRQIERFAEAQATWLANSANRCHHMRMNRDGAPTCRR